jgi:hypothetical protein
MDKGQLIEGIRRINQSAEPQFLEQFDEESLRQYLEHLKNANEKRAKVMGWVKTIPRARFRMVS